MSKAIDEKLINISASNKINHDSEDVHRINPSGKGGTFKK